MYITFVMGLHVYRLRFTVWRHFAQLRIFIVHKISQTYSFLPGSLDHPSRVRISARNLPGQGDLRGGRLPCEYYTVHK